MNFELIQIQTTGTCNARCEMCPYKDSWFMDNHGMMSDELFDKILSQIDPKFNGKICPYLMNEPFADPKIIERLQKIISRVPKAIVEVSTNAELLDNIPDLVTTLLEAKEAKIVISHHGISEDTLEATMKIKYPKTINNIIKLIREVDGRIPIAIQTMAHSKDSMWIYYNTRRVKRYWTKIFSDAKLSWKNVWLSTLEFHNRAANVKMEGWNYNKKVRKIGPDNSFYCKKFDKSLNVLWNGDAVLCCMDYMHEYVYGNLNTQTIEEVFNSNEYLNTINMCSGKTDSKDNLICKRCQTAG